MNALLQSGFLLVVSVIALQKDIPDWQLQLNAGKTAMDAERYADADRTYAGLVASMAASGISDVRLAFALGNLALARTAEGRHIDAMNLIHRSVRVLTSSPSAPPESEAAVWQIVGTCLYYEQQYGGAERAYSKALELLAKSSIADPRVLADLLSNLGSIYQMEHRNRQAAASFKRAATLIDTMNAAPARLKASLLNNTAVLDRSSGRHAEARLALETALRLIEPSRQTDAVTIVHIQNNLALEYMDQKRYNEAFDLFSRAVALIQTSTALPRADVGRILQHYVQCQRKINSKDLPRIEALARAILSSYPDQQPGGRVLDVFLVHK